MVEGGGQGDGPNPHSLGTLAPGEKTVDFLSKFMLYVQYKGLDSHQVRYQSLKEK